jgi:hypothetical protein
MDLLMVRRTRRSMCVPPPGGAWVESWRGTANECWTRSDVEGLRPCSPAAEVDHSHCGGARARFGGGALDPPEAGLPGIRERLPGQPGLRERTCRRARAEQHRHRRLRHGHPDPGRPRPGACRCLARRDRAPPPALDRRLPRQVVGLERDEREHPHLHGHGRKPDTRRAHGGRVRDAVHALPAAPRHGCARERASGRAAPDRRVAGAERRLRTALCVSRREGAAAPDVRDPAGVERERRPDADRSLEGLAAAEAQRDLRPHARPRARVRPGVPARSARHTRAQRPGDRRAPRTATARARSRAEAPARLEASPRHAGGADRRSW